MTLSFLSLVCATGASPVSPRQGNGAVDASAFLRRAYHSSAVLNRRLYIDGGEFSYLNENYSGITYRYLDSLISIDLTSDWSNSSVTLHSTAKPPGVPNLRHGGIWVHRTTGRLYTGFAGTSSQFGDGVASPRGLWSFKPARSGAGSWENHNGSAPDSFTSRPRPFRGQVASGDGFGFLLGGFVSDGNGAHINLGSLVAYDFSSRELANSSDVPVLAQGWEQYGGLTFVPNWGSRGLLIGVGGHEDDDTASFNTALVYDIHNRRWFEQETSGDIPPPRKEFCIAGAQSISRTHDILVYAGWDGKPGTDAVPYDSAFVLTLPGFFWVKADYPPKHPRHGHTCNGVGGGQIVIVGGLDSAHQGGDTYTSPFDTPDPFVQGLAIFDLSKLTWNPSYTAHRGLQTPAPPIQEYYRTRGRHPENGFASPDLERLFAVDDFTDTDENTSTSGATYRSGVDIGTVTGSVVGAAAALAVAGAVVYCVYRRHKRRARARRADERVRALQSQSSSSSSPSSSRAHVEAPPRTEAVELAEFADGRRRVPFVEGSILGAEASGVADRPRRIRFADEAVVGVETAEIGRPCRVRLAEETIVVEDKSA